MDPRVLDNRKKKTDRKRSVFLCFLETHIYKKKTEKETYHDKENTRDYTGVGIH